MFGQVINRVWKIAEFGLKKGKKKGFMQWAAHPHPIFLVVPPQFSLGLVM